MRLARQRKIPVNQGSEGWKDPVIKPPLSSYFPQLRSGLLHRLRSHAVTRRYYCFDTGHAQCIFAIGGNNKSSNQKRSNPPQATSPSSFSPLLLNRLADNLSAETVKGSTLSLQCVDDIEGSDSLALGVFSVCDRVAYDVLELWGQRDPSLLSSRWRVASDHEKARW